MYLSAEHIVKYHNERCILKDASFAIEEKSKIGLIGVNGVGKTTLLKILAGKEHIDSGNIIYKNGLRIHYLPQNPQFVSGKTVYECVMESVSEKQRDTRAFEIKAILTKLGMNDFNQSVDVLSGGQRKKVALASALITDCDLLILDEPTNHLDNDMVEWLERYLIKYSGSLLMVTHDRYFLERITDHLMEIDQGTIYEYEGNYETYLEMKEQRSDMEATQLKKRKSLLKQELAWMRAGVQARGTKSQSRIDRFYELRSQTQVRREAKLKAFDSLTTRLGKKIMEIEHLSMAYGDHVLFQDFNYQVKRQDRIGIVGPNGCGKTTLLNILAKLKEAKAGSVVVGDTVKLGYFHQGDDHMDTSLKVIDYIRDQGDVIETNDGSRSASQMLEQFMFPKQLQHSQIERLSGGERRRLYLLKILINSPNVLFLDEPTNDLDIQTLTILEDYLDDFPGVIITVSHDRYFLDRICDTLFVFQPDKSIKQYAGGYSDYMLVKETQTSAPLKNDKAKACRNQLPSFTSAEKREFEGIEDEIELLDQQIVEIDKKMNELQDQFDEISKLAEKRETVSALLEAKTERWMELQEKYDLIQEARKGL